MFTTNAQNPKSVLHPPARRPAIVPLPHTAAMAIDLSTNSGKLKEAYNDVVNAAEDTDW